MSTAVCSFIVNVNERKELLRHHILGIGRRQQKFSQITSTQNTYLSCHTYLLISRMVTYASPKPSCPLTHNVFSLFILSLLSSTKYHWFSCRSPEDNREDGWNTGGVSSMVIDTNSSNAMIVLVTRQRVWCNKFSIIMINEDLSVDNANNYERYKFQLVLLAIMPIFYFLASCLKSMQSWEFITLLLLLPARLKKLRK